MRILIWHRHGAWSTAFVQGKHEYLIPVIKAGEKQEGGRRPEWPASAQELTFDQAQKADVDVVILQQPEELASLTEEWLGGRRPGRDIPAVYVEHNAPQGRINEMRHPAADHPELIIVHVTHFNSLFWDCGITPTRIIEHGIPDPGYRYSGEIPNFGVVINEAGRRGRVTGTDLLPQFEQIAPVDLFGIGTPRNLEQSQLHSELARRRLYLHPLRWTSLGLSLLEAMHLGMPILALATTEVTRAVPSTAGVVSNDLNVLKEAAQWLLGDSKAAKALGLAARQSALENYGLTRFLSDWDSLLDEVVTGSSNPSSRNFWPKSSIAL